MTRPLVLLLMVVGACSPPVVSRQDWKRYATHRLDAEPFLDEDPVELVNLGRKLYFDERLSLGGDISCNTCHDAATTGVDPRGLAKSAGTTGKPSDNTTGKPSDNNAPTIFNMAPRTAWGWHADALDLSSLLERPLNNFHGLRDQDVDALVDDLGYTEDLERLTGTWESSDEAKVRLTEAIGAYTRTLISSDSPFDRFVGTSYETRDLDAISQDARRGAELFTGRAFCVECHSGPLFTNEEPMNIGVGDPARRNAEGEPLRWRVAPLRDVTVGGPWFHDGLTLELTDVLWHYIDGGNAAFGAEQHVAIQPMDLDGDDMQDLIAFMAALRGAPLPYCHVTPNGACCLDGEPTWDVEDPTSECSALAQRHASRP